MEGPILEILVTIGLFIVAAVGGYVIRYFRNRGISISNNNKDIAKLKDDMIDIKRVLVMLAKKIDRTVEKYHDDYNAAYEELVKDLLTDDITTSRGSCPI